MRGGAIGRPGKVTMSESVFESWVGHLNEDDLPEWEHDGFHFQVLKQAFCSVPGAAQILVIPLDEGPHPDRKGW